MTIHRYNISPLAINLFTAATGGLLFFMGKAPLLEAVQLLIPSGISLVSTISAIAIGCLVENKTISAKKGLAATVAISALALVVTVVALTFLSACPPQMVILGMFWPLFSGLFNCWGAYDRWKKDAQVTLRKKYGQPVLEEIAVVHAQYSEKRLQIEEADTSLLKDMEENRLIANKVPGKT